MDRSCRNCGNKRYIGGSLRCEVTGRIKTPPYTPCGNYIKEIKQTKLEVEW